MKANNKIKSGSAPSNEAYEYVLVVEMTKQYLEGVYHLLKPHQGILPLFIAGDSLTTILTLKGNSSDVSIRTAVGMTTDNIVSLLTKFLDLDVQYTWVPRDNNPSDYNSKVHPDPVSATNSSLWRCGPEMFQDITQIYNSSYGYVCCSIYQFVPTKKINEICRATRSLCFNSLYLLKGNASK